MISVMHKPQQISQMYDYELCNASNKMLDFWYLYWLDMTLKKFRGMFIKRPDIFFVKSTMHEVDIVSCNDFMLSAITFYLNQY